MYIFNRLVLLAVLCFSLLLPPFVVAQGGGEEVSGLEEILVTARKREERLQDVPIAITALTGEEIRSNAISQLEFLSQSIPNLFVSENTGADIIGVRGIHSGVNYGFEQTVGQVFNGFFYGKARLSRLPFLDVQRIEVLKGPQGSLIGKNTTAGVINVTSARPTEELEAWGSVSYESFDGAGEGVTFEGAVSGPLSDAVKGRVALRHEDGGGWVHNLYTNDDVPDKDDWMIRGMLDWDINQNLTASLEWTHADLQRLGQAKQLAYCSPAMIALLVAQSVRTDDCGAPDNRTISVAPKNGQGNFETFETKLDMAGLTINWQLGENTLTSLTGFARYDSLDRSEGDRLPLEILNTRLGEDYEQWTQEFRIASPTGGQFEYLGGAFFQHQENSSTFGLDINLTAILPPPVLARFANNGVFSNNSLTDEEGDTSAVFGQLTWNFTEQWSATVDGRYTDEKKDATQTAYSGVIYTTDQLTPPVPLHTIAADRKENNFSPGLALQWKPNDDANYYASYRRGFKGGGFNHGNLDPQNTVAFNFEFDEEKVDAYEVGAKLNLADSRAQLNIALFYQDFSDLQVSAIDNSQGVAITKITNAAGAVSKGVEVELTWIPVDDLKLFSAIGYNNAEYKDFNNAECYSTQTLAEGCIPIAGTNSRFQSLDGKQIEQAPEWSAVINGEYKWSLTSGLDLTFFAQAIYRDGYFTVGSQEPTTFQDSYLKYDARISLGSVNHKWAISFLAKNIGNKFTNSVGNRVPGFLPLAYQPFVDPGRSYVLQGSVRY